MSIHLHIDKRKQKEHACTNVSEEYDDSFAYGSAFDSSSDDDDDQNFYITTGTIPFSPVPSLSETYGADLGKLCAALKGNSTVDAIMGRLKLVNWVRETKLTPDAIRNLTGNEDRSDEYSVLRSFFPGRIPVLSVSLSYRYLIIHISFLEYTPPNDKWSDNSDLNNGYPTSVSSSAAAQPTHLDTYSAETCIKSLEKKLAQVDEYRGMVRERTNFKTRSKK
ncbi:hypothetical protein K435DRAFT_868796 [Dendrothele bispora CBS 962.96]|uniref:Uncharacterized protein n=1 Tax=Dendrothele bispora (strain CBS 962.96) TaxID=1314807 RepID=A0A4S8LAT1_DENBC|nr:hypothetical protein K435DRAFT_868796 [Dendrothele bispora CBS 962.96]